MGGSYLSSEVQLMYSTIPANLATGHLLGESYPSVEMQLVYSVTLLIGLLLVRLDDDI